MSNDARDVSGCESCPLGAAVARRDFLRDALSRILAAGGALSIFPGRLAPFPIGFTSGTGNGAEKTYPLPASDGVSSDKEESVIVARFRDRVYAFSLACPHQNTAVRWDASNARFQCPKHKSRYRSDGTFIEGRATRSLDRFAVRVEGGQLLVNLDALFREDENPSAWAAAFVSLSEK
jgi:nitrite reductase/ring-hydroxylating ferredoxin subunit